MLYTDGCLSDAEVRTIRRRERRGPEVRAGGERRADAANTPARRAMIIKLAALVGAPNTPISGMRVLSFAAALGAEPN